MSASPTENSQEKDFFVSYNGADRQWAEWVAGVLEEEGYTTIIQAWDIRPGKNFVLEMQRAAKAARKTIAILSDNYLAAAYTQPEWAAAFKADPQGLQSKLIPVRIDRCQPTGMLAPIVYIDLVGLNAEEAKAELLKGVIQGRLKPEFIPFPGDEKDRQAISKRADYPGTVDDLASSSNTGSYSTAQSSPLKRKGFDKKSQLKFKRLPYLINRTKQVNTIKLALNDLLSRTRTDARAARPILFLVSGDEKQCHDLFLARICDTAREVLQLDETAHPLSKRIEWPVNFVSPKDAIERYRKQIWGCFDGYTASSTVEINEYFAQNSVPAIVHTQINIEESDWRKHEAKLLPALVEFWQQWPALLENQILIVCIFFIQYMPTKSASFLHRLCRKPDSLKLVERAIADIESDRQRIILEALPRLDCVKRQEVNDWTMSLPLEELGLRDDDLPTFKAAIRKIYEDSQLDAIPLEDLATAMQNLLARYINRSENAA
ncbi:MAG: TIR domain-containing protein [Synechococcus sp.]